MDIAIYARVSTDDQTNEQQLHALREWADRKGHVIVDEFVDVGSGAKIIRPGLTDLKALITAGRIQLVAVAALDRLGRSLADLVGLLADWDAAGCALYSAREGIDASTPSGRALLQMAGVFAEFERAILIERTKAGLARARRQGKVLGRPKIPAVIERRAHRMLRAGMSQSAVRRELKLGGTTMTRIAKELKREQPTTRHSPSAAHSGTD